MADDARDRAGQLHGIINSVEEARRAANEAWAAHPTSDDPGVVQTGNVYRQRKAAAYQAIFDIAGADPTSATGFESLEWLLLQAPEIYREPAGKPALEMMKRYHAANADIGKAIAQIGYYPPLGLPVETPKLKRQSTYVPVLDLLQAVAEKNPDRTARAQAALALARQDKRMFDYCAAEGGVEAEKLAQRAIAAFEGVLQDYRDCTNLRTMGAVPPCQNDRRGSRARIV